LTSYLLASFILHKRGRHNSKAQFMFNGVTSVRLSASSPRLGISVGKESTTIKLFYLSWKILYTTNWKCTHRLHIKFVFRTRLLELKICLLTQTCKHY